MITKAIRAKVRQIVKEEKQMMLEDVAEKATNIQEKLEKLRRKFEDQGAFAIPESIGERVLGGHARMKRLSIKTTSEMISEPINELVLFMLNFVKNANTAQLVEMHLGHIYFWSTDRFNQPTLDK